MSPASSCLSRLLSAALLLLVLPTIASANGDARNPNGFDRFIVMFKPGSVERGNSVARQRLFDAGSRFSGARATQALRLGVGADVVKLDHKLGHAAAQAFMNRLRRNPSVAYVEIDRIVKPSLVPNDTYYASHQWHYFDPVGGINMPVAWDLADGLGVVAAVIDTGSAGGSDLIGTTGLPGYDFISDVAMANDGNGRDSNPNDPGDWATAGACGVDEPATDSSWHGTSVTGILGASTNNAMGIAGVSKAQVLQLRVLGRCGGHSSDVADAIRWAVGGSVPGVPANTFPAEVINLSLGSLGVCGPTMQAAINQATAAGAVVVVAAGNDAADASAYEPANCANVVVVGANLRTGARAPYSNFGSAVDVSAPGGGSGGYLVSTSNFGATVPSSEGYAYVAGTSMSAPHVSGTVALMQSAKVNTPAAIEAMLKSTARPLPIACAQGCGAGIINAAAAVGAAKGGALTIEDQRALEGSGDGMMTFTVRLSKAMAGPVTFDISTTAGTAADDDFVPLNLQAQTIPAGATSKSFSVHTFGDLAAEDNEDFSIAVSNVSGIAVADGQAMGTLVNDDPIALPNETWLQVGNQPPGSPVPVIVGGQYAFYSIDVPPGRTSLTIRTGASPNVGVGSGDADLLVKFGSLPSFSNADCISENEGYNETCTFDAPQAGTYYVMVYAYSDVFYLGVYGAFVPVPGPTLGISLSSSQEGNTGTKEMMFIASLPSSAANPVSFDISTIAGTAMPGVDYIEKTLGLTIPAGSQSVNFFVTVIGDSEVEADETFAINVSNVVGATPPAAPTLARIMNDDQAQLSVADVSLVEGDSGESTATFLVQLSRPMPIPVRFDISTVDGTATAGSDYVARNLQDVVMDAGRTQLRFEVNVHGDTSPESDEAFSVKLSDIHDAGYDYFHSAMGTIGNDDGAAVAAGRRTTRSAQPAKAQAQRKSAGH